MAGLMAERRNQKLAAMRTKRTSKPTDSCRTAFLVAADTDLICSTPNAGQRFRSSSLVLFELFTALVVVLFSKFHLARPLPFSTLIRCVFEFDCITMVFWPTLLPRDLILFIIQHCFA